MSARTHTHTPAHARTLHNTHTHTHTLSLSLSLSLSHTHASACTHKHTRSTQALPPFIHPFLSLVLLCFASRTSVSHIFVGFSRPRLALQCLCCQDVLEACDDGNLVDGDGCDSSCAIEVGWTCDGRETHNNTGFVMSTCTKAAINVFPQQLTMVRSRVFAVFQKCGS
jgi:cysteine-rich repeat protein